MTNKKTGSQQTMTRAKEAAEGTAVRNRVRELSVAAFRDRDLSLGDVPKLVQEVLKGAAEAVEKSIPTSQRNVLRAVFDGLSEGVHSIAVAGSAAVDEARTRSKALKGKNVSVAMKQARIANADFLNAVEHFAGKASKAVRTELETLVAQAKKTGPEVSASIRKVTKAADGRLMELANEAARASVHVARQTVGDLAMGAGGFLEGLAEVVTPKSRPQPGLKSKRASALPSRKKTARKARPAKKRKS